MQAGWGLGVGMAGGGGVAGFGARTARASPPRAVLPGQPPPANLPPPQARLLGRNEGRTDDNAATIRKRFAVCRAAGGPGLRRGPGPPPPPPPPRDPCDALGPPPGQPPSGRIPPTPPPPPGSRPQVFQESSMPVVAHYEALGKARRRGAPRGGEGEGQTRGRPRCWRGPGPTCHDPPSTTPFLWPTDGRDAASRRWR